MTDQPSTSSSAGSRLFTVLRPVIEDLGEEGAVYLPGLVCEVTRADYAAIGVVKRGTQAVEHVLAADADLPAHADLAEALLRARTPELVADGDPLQGTAELETGERCEYVIGALSSEKRVNGATVALIDGSTGFSPVDLAALGLLLPWLGRSIAVNPDPPHGRGSYQDRLRREAAVAATERERQRWARNLHDETLQALGVLRFRLASALEVPSEQGERAAMTSAVAALGDHIESLRGIIDDLRPAVLDQLGLGPAVHALVARVRRTWPLRIDVRLALTDPGERLPDHIELLVYRFVQEALNNIGRHAKARSVRVAVAQRHAHIEVLVTDDGCGFDVHAPRGAGLVGMAERVALVHGQLEIRSRRGTGTTVEAQIPL